MKICCLKGSPRKNGNTNSLVNIILKGFEEAGERVTVYDLYDMDLRPCLACRGCQKDWSIVNCVQNDDMAKIFESVMDCDLLLLATPIYSWYCTAPMKAALDRMVYALNMYYGGERGPSLWKGKKVALVTTCGYPPEKGSDLFEDGIKRYCKHSQLEYIGMLCERHMGYKVPFMDYGKEERAAAFAEDLIRKLSGIMQEEPLHHADAETAGSKMKGVIRRVTALKPFILEAEFTGGEIRQYDCRKLIDEFPAFQAMVRDPEIFMHPKVACAGYGIVWNDELDVASEEIWEKGKVIR